MNNINVEIIPGFEVSNEDLSVINRYRELKFKRDVVWDHKVNNYFHDRTFFLAKLDGELKAFGTLRRIHIFIKNVEYKILGIQAVASIEERKGYGKAVMQSMVNYANDNNEVLIGFCTPNNRDFYLKSGLKVKQDAMNKFFYKQDNEIELSDEGDVIYYSKDKNAIIEAIESGNKIIHLINHW